MIRRKNIADAGLVVGEISDPEECAKIHARINRAKRNLDWLEQHWPDLMPQARGKHVVVAGQEAHIADSAEAAWAWAASTHPEDDGALVQYVRTETGPRIYANRWRMA
ncbi:MAG TPA: hypothetical protein VFE62_23455 [Gemmataceae bacterium]|nr:hypothetical protein [Gemmataceae bacterium]